MKAQLGISRTIPFFDSAAEVGAEPFVLQILDASGGVELAVLTMTQVTTAPNLYLSAAFIPEDPGQYQLRFKYGNVPVVIYSDTLEAGTPISDFPIGAEVDIVLESSIVGGIGQTVTAHLYNSSGSSVFPLTYASYIGDQAVSTISVNNLDQVTIQVLPDTAPTGAQTVQFLCAPAETSGGAALYGFGVGTDTATYQIDGHPPGTIDLNGAGPGQASYIAALNAQMGAVYVSDDGGNLKITTDSQGSDSQITLSDFGGTFAANTGLAEGTFNSNPALSNVGNSAAVTFFELKLLFETLIMTAGGAQGDRLLVTLEDDTNYFTLTATAGSAGATSQIDVQSGTASVLSALGITALGSQGGNIVAQGSDGVSTQAPYAIGVDGYVIQNHTFTTAQEAYVVWHDAGVQTHLTHYLITPAEAKEVVQITAGRTSGLNGTPHTITTVTVSELDGTQVAQGVTDIAGSLRLEIPPGEYIFTLTKAGSSFTTNNFSYTVFNSKLEASDPYLYSEPEGTDVQAIQLISEVFNPTVTSPPSPASLCTLYATLYHMNGTPVKNATVHVGLIHRPQLFSGTAVFDTQRTYTTDSNGYVEFSLVQGIQVDVSIAPLSLKRRIEVPDNAGPINLMTLMSGADDPFDVLVPNIISAPKRTL